MLAAAYVRSSKDRSDVSLAAQLTELRALAGSRDLSLVATYEDAVQRGSTDDRPAFQRLIADIKRRDRGWDHLLVYDTSRLARGRYIAQAFRHQCKKYGVTIVCARVPDTDPVSAVILEAVFEAMDEVHSIMSRDKALAGMAENVRRGYRAGGRAPWGYSLLHEATGAVRDGRPVMKSRLVPSPDSPVAAGYLKQRAKGVPRVAAASGTGKTTTTLVDVEWNALVYAGMTVWNRHRDKRSRGTGASRRKPRAEWQVQDGTHEALITPAEAEAILAQLESSVVGQAVSAAKRSVSRFLLSEVLVCPDGRRWEGSGKHYRLRASGEMAGKWIPADRLDRAVLAQVRSDVREPEFLRRLVDAARNLVVEDYAAPLRGQIARLLRQKDRAARLALEEDGEAFRSLVSELSRQIEALEREAAALEKEQRATDGLRSLTVNELRQALLASEDDSALVRALERVELDPQGNEAVLTYRLSVASPRDVGRFPVTLEGWKKVAL